MWYELKDNFVIFYIRVVPNSSKNMVSGILDNTLKVKIKAPAVEGAANKELIKFLSKLLKIPKSELFFIHGKTSKRKSIRMPYNETIKYFIKELENE